MEYVEGKTPDSGSGSKMIEYLEACRQLFEKGILSHEKISDGQSIILQNITDGYAFFVGWADYAWAEGNKFNPKKGGKVSLVVQ